MVDDVSIEVASSLRPPLPLLCADMLETMNMRGENGKLPFDVHSDVEAPLPKLSSKRLEAQFSSQAHRTLGYVTRGRSSSAATPCMILSVLYTMTFVDTLSIIRR